MFLFFSNSYIAGRLMGLLETPVLPIAHLDAHYDYAIVLGGATDLTQKPYDRVYLNQAADRVMHTVQLYKLGKVSRIMLLGGSGSLQEMDVTEAQSMKKVLVLSGVDPRDIIAEDSSRNTRENALNAVAIFKRERKLGQAKPKTLLVTSAFHMPRAKACFEKVGLQVIPFPVDFRTSGKLPFDAYFIPSAEALACWNILMRELSGFLTYKLFGYC